MKTTYYVIFVRGDVEPEVFGPLDQESMRDKAAHILRRTHGLDHGIFPAEIRDGVLKVGSYPSSFFFKQEG